MPMKTIDQIAFLLILAALLACWLGANALCSTSEKNPIKAYIFFGVSVVFVFVRLSMHPYI